MTWIVIALIACTAVEVLYHLPLAPAARRMSEIGRRSVRVITSQRISEHWKEKATGAYARGIARETLILMLCLGLVAALVTVALLVGERVLPGLIGRIESLPGILTTSAAATLYYLARRRLD